MYSFAQLIGEKALGIPISKKADCWCRECGGLISKENAVKKEYPETWVDEGLITYSDSRWVCPACVKLTKGSTSRTNLMPHVGAVMVVSPSFIHPKAEVWEKALIDRNTKKEDVYTNTITLVEFLQDILPKIEIPFGVVCTEVTSKNRKHFIRVVPLNYTKQEIMICVMPNFHFISIRPEIFLQAFRDSLEITKLTDPKMQQAFKERNYSQEFGLSKAEIFMLYQQLKDYKKHKKGE